MSAPRSSSTAPPSKPQPDLPRNNEQHLYFINSTLTDSAFLSTTKHLFGHTHLIGSKQKTLLTLFKRHFIPWAIISFDTAMKEILGPSSAKISNGSFSVHDHDKISHVISLSQKINPFLALASFKLEEGLPPFLLLDDNTSFPTHTFLDVWWSFALFEWHTYITVQFKKVIHNSFLSKMELGLGFYNFTQHELPPNINDLLIKGKKFSPLSTEDAAINPGQDRFLFVEYMASLIQWTAKHFDGINLDPSHIIEKGITSTLAYCAYNSKSFSELWCSFLDKFEATLEQDTFNPEPHAFLLDPSYQKCLPSPGHEWNIPEDSILTCADKHFGIVLLPIQRLMKAEVDMMTSMNATITSHTPQSLLDKVNKEDHDIRTDKCPHLRFLLSKFPPIKPELQEIPFLKLNPKIHKLTQEQITRKDTSTLKFRPVCDSKFYPTKPASQAMAYILVKLKTNIIKKFPSMAHFYPSSGYDVKHELRSTQFPNNNAKFYLLASCDLSDAYTNCSLPDIIKAFSFLSSIVYDNDIDLSIVKKLGHFALSNNFIESRTKIFHYDPILPMGNCLSGDALDIIAMAGELPVLINPPLSMLSRSLLPPYTSHNMNVIKAFSYNRYRDDTRIILTGDSPADIISTMAIIGSHVFPSHIPTSFEFSCFHGSFLDCCFYINFSGRGFSTYPRLNYSRPSITVNSLTCSLPNQLICSHASNLIRFKRLCSEESIFSLIQQLYSLELKICGFGDQHWNNVYNKFITAMNRLEIRYLSIQEMNSRFQSPDSLLPIDFPSPYNLLKAAVNFPPTLKFHGPHSNLHRRVRIMISHINKSFRLHKSSRYPDSPDLYLDDHHIIGFPPVSPPNSIEKYVISKRIYRAKISPLMK